MASDIRDRLNGGHGVPKHTDNKKRNKKHIATNPLQHGIQQFLLHHPASSSNPSGVSLPKRYTVYHPLLLLPANVFTHPQPWAERYASLSDAERQELYASIAASFAHMGVTHIAINAPILLTNTAGDENRMRSPTGLVPLYGDFGESISSPCNNHSGKGDPFENAFWVQTVQNGGIIQCWAPLYTMFSRGNITEKARILGLEQQQQQQQQQGRHRFTGLDDASLKGQRVEEISVVDLYAGIGYFVFSYLKRGVKRVWGWELNAWSVEGLRRGCLANGWNCRVVRLDAGGDGQCDMNSVVETLLHDLTDTDRVVIFQGDNQTAPTLMDAIRPVLKNRGLWAPVRHVNLGLLPTSRPTWEPSLRLLDREYGGWAHVHENVDVADIESKKMVIVAEYAGLAARLQQQEGQPSITCDHVEQVKTYAPGVMHCVYDIQVDF
ncbi:hypothetical protein UA08_08433 [Talaromyces atroroseus]|uniref:tRNA wybutosine-synthesizing protein 2 n=1 Tax=Talaromyces atroroseus TaxID=1441469 RepID=A0A1Q5Q7W2_TALAT|nr:hypothetical protein UA08_08433 [Talaromyces atroroseus]OKL56309.1 hypothetical protein UA08_08433 [Talaromyces atroroseus]